MKNDFFQHLSDAFANIQYICEDINECVKFYRVLPIKSVMIEAFVEVLVS